MSLFYLKGVSVLSQGRLTSARHAQPDVRRHEALHAGRHPVHGGHGSVAGHDAVAAKLPLWRLAHDPEKLQTFGRDHAQELLMR